jgi:hypothetical protein
VGARAKLVRRTGRGTDYQSVSEEGQLAICVIARPRRLSLK